MARLRIPGGCLKSFQLRELANIARDLTTGYVQITTRANLQIRLIAPKDAPEVLVAEREPVDEEDAVLLLQFIREPPDQLVVRLVKDGSGELLLVGIDDAEAVVGMRKRNDIEVGPWAEDTLPPSFSVKPCQL